MPCGLTFELHMLTQKDGLEVNAKWICNQPKPRVHPQLPHILVCSSAYLRCDHFSIQSYHFLMAIES